MPGFDIHCVMPRDVCNVATIFRRATRPAWTSAQGEGYFRHPSFVLSWDCIQPCFCKTSKSGQCISRELAQMEILTTRAARCSTRMRVEISMTVTSVDRKHPF
jgi:hypothetical protein